LKPIVQNGAPVASAGRGRLVFSSSGIPIRVPESAAKQRARYASLVTSATWVAESLFATLFPSDCRICSAPLTNISRLPVCELCLESIAPTDGIVCAICSEKIQSSFVSENNARCGLCQKKAPPFAKAVSYGSYSGNLRELVHLFKYEQVRPAANVLGKLLAEAVANLEPHFADGSVVVIPVPLYKSKRRQRGFNQAEFIAKAALRSLKSESLNNKRFVLKTNVLRRLRQTESQIGLTRHQRRENMRGAFGVANANEIAKREVLLIDDVFTTGTTAAECTRVLLKAGASNVWVATVARTQKADVQAIELTGSQDPEALAIAG
jgi:ComF family protein